VYSDSETWIAIRVAASASYAMLRWTKLESYRLIAIGQTTSASCPHKSVKVKSSSDFLFRINRCSIAKWNPKRRRVL